MRQIKVLAVLFALLPGIAAAQQILPKNTVLGRLGVTASGPAQAIPFATLFANAGIAAGPQSCASHNWFSSLGTGGGLVCTQPSFADLTSTIAAAQLIPPTASTLGGVQSKDCTSGSQFVQKINTDGTITCATPAGAGTVTEQKNTASAGLTNTGNCDNTSSNSSSPCNTAMNLDSAIIASNSSLSTTVVNNLMMGWGSAGGGACHLTPKYSGRIFAIITGTMSETSGGGLTLQAHWGTGTAPNNGATSTGTAIGSSALVNAGGTTSIAVPFTIGGVINVGSTGTAVWIDGLPSASGSVSVSGASCSMHEIL